jgi:hypothetical protein
MLYSSSVLINRMYTLGRESVAWFLKVLQSHLKLKDMLCELGFKEVKRVLISFQNDKYTKFLNVKKIHQLISQMV